MDAYKIEVFTTPIDEEMTSAPYCWCVLKSTLRDGWYNVGHGWAKTPEAAWADAYKYYNDIATI